MSAQRRSPETTPDLGAGDPNDAELEPRCGVPQGLGGAPDARCIGSARVALPTAVREPAVPRPHPSFGERDRAPYPKRRTMWYGLRGGERK